MLRLSTVDFFVCTSAGSPGRVLRTVLPVYGPCDVPMLSTSKLIIDQYGAYMRCRCWYDMSVSVSEILELTVCVNQLLHFVTTWPGLVWSGLVFFISVWSPSALLSLSSPSVWSGLLCSIPVKS